LFYGEKIFRKRKMEENAFFARENFGKKIKFVREKRRKKYFEKVKMQE